MRPAFSSIRQAAAFAFLLLALLALPVVVGKTLQPPRVQSYAAQTWGSGPYPWIQQQLFEEKSDIDIAFVGSSHILHCMDARRVQAELSKKLGRPATVRVVGWGGAGYDALYFITKDLLENRRVRMLVFYDENNNPGSRNTLSPAWFRWSENAGDLIGLPLAEQAYFYFASLVGMPRNLLCLIRSNLSADLQGTNYWEEHYRSTNLADNLGSTTSELGFANTDVADSTIPFVRFSPSTQATPTDACVYSAITQTNFTFDTQPLPVWQTHFAKKFAALAQAHGCQLLLLNIPVLADVRAPKIEGRVFWPELLNTNLVMLGIPPAKMFAGIPDEDAHKLFFNPVHLNANGQAYFTSLILPALLQHYAAQPNP